MGGGVGIGIGVGSNNGNLFWFFFIIFLLFNLFVGGLGVGRECGGITREVYI
jgi:hypothetical protein